MSTQEALGAILDGKLHEDRNIRAFREVEAEHQKPQNPRAQAQARPEQQPQAQAQQPQAQPEAQAQPGAQAQPPSPSVDPTSQEQEQEAAALPQAPPTSRGRTQIQGMALPDDVQAKIESERKAQPATPRPTLAQQQAAQQSLALGGAGAQGIPGAQANQGGQARSQARASIPAGATVTFVGELDDVSAQSVWIRDAQGALQTLGVNRNTTVIQNGRPTNVIDLQEGKPVRASYEMRFGQPVATSLVVIDQEPAKR
jgi:hypothetical protein